MGSYFSSAYNTNDGNSTTNSDIQKLQSVIDTQKQSIGELRNKLQLLQCEKNSTYCVREGIICPIDEDVTETISENKVNKDYKYLVFSGGGIKGLAYCGAIEVLESYGILKNIKGYAASSAGTIIAALLAVGYTPKELKSMINDVNFNDIVDDKWGVIRDTINIVKDYGLAPGNYLINMLGEFIEKKTGKKDYTIDDLYRDKGITLVFTGTDLNHKKTIYFYPNHPDKAFREMPIISAIRISMSIPFLFEPIKFNDCYCVDGGVLDLYPLHVFDGKYPGDPEAKLNLCSPNPSVLGLNIISSTDFDEIVNDKKDDINSFFQYGISYIDLYLMESERKILSPSYWSRTINIITPNIPLTKFELSEKQKNELIKNGKDYTEDFFKKDDNL